MILVIYKYTPELELSMLIYDYKSTRVSSGRIQGGGRTKYPKSFRASLRSAQFF